METRGVSHFDVFVIDQHYDMTDGILQGVEVIDRLRKMGARGIKILCTGSNSVLERHFGREWEAVDILWGKPLPSKQNICQDLSDALLIKNSPDETPARRIESQVSDDRRGECPMI